MGLTSFVQDKQLTIALSGEIDHHVAKDTIHAVGVKIDTFMPLVCVLDFKEVSFMDSSGIAIVISAVRKMKELGGNVRIKNVSRQPYKVLAAAGIERIAEIC